MITLEGLTARQVQIADMLWKCDTLDEVNRLVRNMPESYRKDAVTLKELMIAATLDEVSDTRLAQRVLSNFG